jgi:hypothetical protein
VVLTGLIRYIEAAARATDRVSTSRQAVRADRQRSQPLTGRRKDCIALRRRDRRYAGHPNATGRGIARPEVDIDLRRFMQTQHAVLMQILLLRAAA